MDDFRAIATEYFEELREAYSDGGGTEHTGRTALHNFLGKCAKLFKEPVEEQVEIKQEPAQVKGSAPDFQISKHGMVIGYVETKKMGTDCRKTAASKQIKKYRDLNKNILITNYHEFYSLKTQREVFCYSQEELQAKTGKFSLYNLEELKDTLRQFFDTSFEKIGRAKDLAEKLARHCHYLRDELERNLIKQAKKEIERDRIYGIYKSFTERISSELTLKEFSDAFAQTLVYGTLLARLNKKGIAPITLDNAEESIPNSFLLIAELVKFLNELKNDSYRKIGWIVESILSIINNLDLHEIKRDLNFYKPLQKDLDLPEEKKALYTRDPFIYFYENFLSVYDEDMRKKRGVYYTPVPIVNFIVRGIDDMLKVKFKLREGLANRGVTALDFACGTGTFLLETMRQIFKNTETNLSRKILDEHICKNIYGFEFLIAAYTVAHLKLSQYLIDAGLPLKDKQRLRIYLANTLENFNVEDLASKEDYILNKLTEEGSEAQKIKDKDILVIMGNPPYSGHSLNNSKKFTQPIKKYKAIDNEPIKEKTLKWLQDDYVKFMRFAEYKMEKAEKGIVGIITNHSFIDNITFRGMRHSLLKTFDQIYILNMQGSARKKIKPPNHQKDENIFNIQQGVAISFFVKNKGLKKSVNYVDVWGSRIEKFEYGITKKYKDIEWQKINPQKPFYFFNPFNNALYAEYQKFWSISDILLEKNTGIITKKDRLTLQFSKTDLKKTIHHLLRLTPDQIRKNYTDYNWDSRDGKAELLSQSLQEIGYNENLFKKCLYRPFDSRWTYYNRKPKGFLGWPVYDVMRHMITNNNLGLITVRQASFSETWQHVGITNKIMEGCAISNRGREINYLFPLYLYAPEQGEKVHHRLKDLFLTQNPFNGKDVIENIAPDFRRYIDGKYNKILLPEKIFFYTYAILHSSLYRNKYLDFLRIDFPRIPFPDDKSQFLDLAKIGEGLKQAHLLEKLPKTEIEYKGKGNHEVAKVNFLEKNLHINSTQYFTPIDKEIWDFHIGGYQVLDKYLKERKGRELSLDEIEHVKNIAAALSETRKLMADIDLIAKKFL